jgi:hypothetical protein
MHIAVYLVTQCNDKGFAFKNKNTGAESETMNLKLDESVLRKI